MEQDYHSVIKSTISPGDAFKSICNVSAWWTRAVEGNTEQLHDLFTVRFGETFTTFKVIELIADKKIVWLAVDCNLHFINDKTEWKGTKIKWEITTNSGSTQIEMTHLGLVPEKECYNDCTKGWNFYFGESLLKLVTEGKGLPDTPKALRNYAGTNLPESRLVSRPILEASGCKEYVNRF